MAKPVTQAGAVRARLMDGRMRVSDRLARFVGLETYEAAGGRVVRDLFDSDAVYLEDPSLVALLAEKALGGEAEKWGGQGWGWVETSIDGARPDGLSSVRLHPVWRDPTEDEASELGRLEAELDALDAELEASGTDDDARWTRRDDLEAAYETIRQAARAWEAPLKAFAGVLLSISHDGELAVTEGLVRKADEAMVAAYRREEAGARGEDDGAAMQDLVAIKRSPGLPRSVVRDLTTIRTQALRARVAEAPPIALAVCVAAMLNRVVSGPELPGVALSIGQARVVEEESLAAARATLLERAGSSPLAWALDQPIERLLSALAVLVAGAIDVSHEGAGPSDNRRQETGDVLAQAIDLDMTAYWSPDTAFWSRLPKTLLIEALAQSPGMERLSQKAAGDLVAAVSKLKKEEVVARVETAWRDRGYLPDVLVTPVAAGALAVNQATNVSIAAE